MPQIMTSGAECDEIFGVVGAAIGAGGDVVQVQESSVVTAFAPATMSVASQYLATSLGWDG